jgi:hypothetical protein
MRQMIAKRCMNMPLGGFNLLPECDLINHAVILPRFGLAERAFL